MGWTTRWGTRAAGMVLVATALAACTSDDPDGDVGGTTTSSTAAPSPSTTSTLLGAPNTVGAAPESPARLRTGDSPLGPVVTDLSGFATYTKVTGDPLSCDDRCDLFLPYLTEGAPVAGDGLEASLLGTVTRPDGALQVTVAGHPLYRCTCDSTPGFLQGHELAGAWYAVTPSGEPAAGDS